MRLADISTFIYFDVAKFSPPINSLVNLERQNIKQLATNSTPLALTNGDLLQPQLYEAIIKILYNNFQNNSQSNLYLSDTQNDIDATYNWWATTNQQAISQTIYDKKNNSTLGAVTFTPFLTAPKEHAVNVNTSGNPEFPAWIIVPIFAAIFVLAFGLMLRRRAKAKTPKSDV